VPRAARAGEKTRGGGVKGAAGKGGDACAGCGCSRCPGGISSMPSAAAASPGMRVAACGSGGPRGGRARRGARIWRVVRTAGLDGEHEEEAADSGGIGQGSACARAWRSTTAGGESCQGGPERSREQAHGVFWDGTKLTQGADGQTTLQGGGAASRGDGGRSSSPGSLQGWGKRGVMAGTGRGECEEALVSRNLRWAHRRRRIEDGRIWGRRRWRLQWGRTGEGLGFRGRLGGAGGRARRRGRGAAMLAESAAAGVVCRSCCTMVHEEEQGRRGRVEEDPDGWVRGHGETQKKWV
jgi:hypothetical protein